MNVHIVGDTSPKKFLCVSRVKRQKRNILKKKKKNLANLLECVSDALDTVMMVTSSLNFTEKRIFDVIVGIKNLRRAAF